MMTHRIWIVVMMALGAMRAHAQDLHFSQWFNTPLLTNPANTGFIPSADFRLGANYRNQWSSVMAVPYKTMSIWGDAQVFRDRIETGWMGLGGVILRDVAGAGSLTSTKVYASVAYHQEIAEAHLLSLGFNFGWVNKRINSSLLKFPDQFDGQFFDNTLPTSVYIDNPNVNYFDVQAGLNYAYFPSDRVYINGGVSAMHLNKARESFFSSDGSGQDNRIAPRYTVFGNASIKVADDVIINPMAYYTRQTTASELVAGGNIQYNLSGEGGESQLYGGLYLRPGDAVIPLVGFQYKQIRLMFTYDVTLSSLKAYNSGRGAFEFGLMHEGYYQDYNGNRRQSMCPTF